jgi:hypothetical protein
MRIVYFCFVEDSADPWTGRGGLITFESESTEEAERLVADAPSSGRICLIAIG